MQCWIDKWNIVTMFVLEGEHVVLDRLLNPSSIWCLNFNFEETDLCHCFRKSMVGWFIFFTYLNLDLAFLSY